MSLYNNVLGLLFLVDPTNDDQLAALLFNELQLWIREKDQLSLTLANDLETNEAILDTGKKKGE